MRFLANLLLYLAVLQEKKLLKEKMNEWAIALVVVVVIV